MNKEIIAPRAWLKKNKQMVDVKSIDYHGCTVEYISGWDRCLPPNPYIETVSFNDIELLWPTYLEDEYEEIIYQGEILECTHWFFDGSEVEENFRASVGLRSGSFVLENIKSRYYSEYTGYKNGTGTCWIGAIDWNESDYKIIGNRFENPELLEGG